MMTATFNRFSIIYPLAIFVASFLAGWEGFKTTARFFSFALYQKWPMGSTAFVLLNQTFKHIALNNHFYKAWRSEKDVSLAILGRSYTTGNADVQSGIASLYSKLRRYGQGFKKLI